MLLFISQSASLQIERYFFERVLLATVGLKHENNLTENSNSKNSGNIVLVAKCFLSELLFKVCLISCAHKRVKHDSDGAENSKIRWIISFIIKEIVHRKQNVSFPNKLCGGSLLLDLNFSPSSYSGRLAGRASQCSAFFIKHLLAGKNALLLAG